MLCNFAESFPPFAAAFLERDKALSKKFREETITDMMMSSLITLGHYGIIVDFPNEPTTGADMEWNFVRHDMSSFFRIYVQSKRLFGNGSRWTRYSYRELYHSVGTPPQLQANILSRTARSEGRGCFPLYAFYNPKRVCESAKGISPEIQGVNLADGYIIDALVSLGYKSKIDGLAIKNRTIKTIQPLFFSLRDIFCPMAFYTLPPIAYSGSLGPLFLRFTGSSGRLAVAATPDPKTIQNRLAKMCLQARDRYYSQSLQSDIGDDATSLRETMPVPAISKKVPPEIAAIVKNPQDYVRSSEKPKLNRWRITLISRSDEGVDQTD